MTKMKKRLLTGSLLLVIALLLVAGVGHYAFASRMMAGGRWGSCGWGGDRGGHSFKMDIVRALNPMDFTEEQWTKFDEVSERVRARGRELHGDMRNTMWKRRGELRGMMTAEGFDQEKAKTLIAEARPGFVSMVEELLRARNDLYGMLDESQRGKVESVLAVVEKRLEEASPARGAHFAAMANRLNLTAEQRSAMESLMNERAPKMHGFAKAAFEHLKAELPLLAEGPMTDEQIAESAGKIADLAAEALMTMGEARAQMWEILTPAQREEMSKMRGGHFGGMHRRPGRMRK